LRTGVAWGGIAFFGAAAAAVERLAAQSCDGLPLGELVGLVPLRGDRGRETPFGELVGGSGLDARLFTDLSRIQANRLITPTGEMFVRTAAPRALESDTWAIATHGFGSTAASAISIESLRRDAQPMGAHLIECSGNVDPDNFGLMSVTDWDGVPLSRVVETLGTRQDAVAVLVGGLDDPETSRTSSPGASWVFPLEKLPSSGAFLAVRMNGALLTRDHGFPVRLVVPGWYGCSWIKWVNELRLVGADQPTTSQMIEFSLRTHQRGVPALASDYEPPVIDLVAMPIRVEKRRLGGRLEYRIVGIVWGGDRPVDRLQIRFKVGEPPTLFVICPPPRTHRTWSLWDYRWRPTEPGIYDIVLKAVDPTIRTRRLDVSFYVRRVIIEEV
jgi:DMSO/TMAO reductase YedYZ molybdopterin-dependent catalytic subunit